MWMRASTKVVASGFAPGFDMTCERQVVGRDDDLPAR